MLKGYQSYQQISFQQVGTKIILEKSFKNQCYHLKNRIRIRQRITYVVLIKYELRLGLGITGLLLEVGLGCSQ